MDQGESDRLAAELVSRCFHARTVAHVLHLQTTSYAVHKALEFFYDGIVPLVDTACEIYQGAYSVLKQYPDELLGADTPMELMSGLREWIVGNRKKIGSPDDSHLQNAIDEIMALIDKTSYRLKYLK